MWYNELPETNGVHPSQSKLFLRDRAVQDQAPQLAKSKPVFNAGHRTTSIERAMAKMRHIRLTAAILIGLAQTTQAQMEMDSPLPDFNPERMVRFESVSQAERRRESLQKYIWPEGLPSTRPKVSNVMQPSELEKVSADLIDHVDRFEITVGPFDFEAIAFRVISSTSPRRVQPRRQGL